MESWSMIGTKICTSPQPSNSCRFVCNNLRAHKCWYSVCVPMTLKQAVHGQGGMTWSFAEYGARSPKSCGRCYSVVGCWATELKLVVQNLEPPGQILVPICVQRRHENRLCQHSAQARSFLALSRIASRSSKVVIVVGKAGVAINANQVLFGIVKHGPFEGVQTSWRVFASMTCFCKQRALWGTHQSGSQHNMINMQQMVHMKRISEWSERGRHPLRWWWWWCC